VRLLGLLAEAGEGPHKKAEDAAAVVVMSLKNSLRWLRFSLLLLLPPWLDGWRHGHPEESSLSSSGVLLVRAKRRWLSILRDLLLFLSMDNFCVLQWMSGFKLLINRAWTGFETEEIVSRVASPATTIIFVVVRFFKCVMAWAVFFVCGFTVWNE